VPDGGEAANARADYFFRTHETIVELKALRTAKFSAITYVRKAERT